MAVDLRFVSAMPVDPCALKKFYKATHRVSRLIMSSMLNDQDITDRHRGSIAMPLRPLVTITIPTYNRSWGLRDALKSAFAQTYRPLEVIVSDDASPDDTQDVVREFTAPELIYHRQPQNVGMVPNWGYGVFAATGKYIVVLSDDDLLSPLFVEERVAALEADSKSIVAFSPYRHQSLSGEFVGLVGDLGSDKKSLDPDGLLLKTLSRAWWIASAMYRTEQVKKIWPDLQDDDLVLDFGLNLRLSLRRLGTGIYLPTHNFTARIHEGQNSQAKWLRATEQGCEVVERVLATERCSSLQTKMLKTELAHLNTTIGLRLLANKNRVEAARHFMRAIRSDPKNAIHWKRMLVGVRRRERLQHWPPR
jgi:glycosyltransferase involved in cell wall biosynthesis